MLDVEEMGVDCRGRIGCTKRCNGCQAALSKNWLRPVPHLEKESPCTVLGVRMLGAEFVPKEGLQSCNWRGLEFVIVLGFVSTQPQARSKDNTNQAEIHDRIGLNVSNSM
jgi:hypothetical protein